MPGANGTKLEATGLRRALHDGWAQHPSLTSRQHLILAHAARSGSLKEAARDLGISYQRLRNALHEIYTLLDVPNLSLACIAVGWLILPEA